MKSLPRLLACWGILHASTGAWSWLPPHPNSTRRWETVYEMRERLNLAFNYTPRHIHPETCRYFTEHECEEADMAMRAQQQRNRKLQAEVNPKTGRIKVLVLMVLFTDHTERELIPISEVDALWQTSIPAWISANSQGIYEIEAQVIDWIMTDNTEIYYSFGKRGLVPEAQKMAWPLLDELDNRPDWSWSDFDGDGDGRLDSVVVVHSGYGAETEETDCFGRGFEDRIWPHGYTGTGGDAWVSMDGNYRLAGYTIASAFTGICGNVPNKIGITVHEYMHTLGLEDLYDGTDTNEASGVGAWDIMAEPYGQKGDENMPGHLSAWSKALADWLTPKIISEDGIYTLKAAEISAEAYRININPFGFLPEYLLIENRQPLEFDQDLWGSGLVIYHVDDAAKLQESRGYPGQAGWPGNGNHYQVSVVQKDGKYDLEQGVNKGDEGDMWQPGDMLGPGMGGTVYPNTDSYQAGFIYETGLSISVLEQSGTDIRFRVSGLGGGDEAETDMPTTSPTLPPTGTTLNPTVTPTTLPTESASEIPSVAPSAVSTSALSEPATDTPSLIPSVSPSVEAEGSQTPSSGPSFWPSRFPTEARRSSEPSTNPSQSPSSFLLSEGSGAPTAALTGKPSIAPSGMPIGKSSASPTADISLEPTTRQSSALPSIGPTSAASATPTEFATLSFSSDPSAQPSTVTSGEPSNIPTSFLSSVPTSDTSRMPSSMPTILPVLSQDPSMMPSLFPSFYPSEVVSELPSSSPATSSPSWIPSSVPSAYPTIYPSLLPSSKPSRVATMSPTNLPSFCPTKVPSVMPTVAPTMIPTLHPSNSPSDSMDPTQMPSSMPSNKPTTPYLSQFTSFNERRPTPDEPLPYLYTLPRPPSFRFRSPPVGSMSRPSPSKPQGYLSHFGAVSQAAEHQKGAGHKKGELEKAALPRFRDFGKSVVTEPTLVNSFGSDTVPSAMAPKALMAVNEVPTSAVASEGPTRDAPTFIYWGLPGWVLGVIFCFFLLALAFGMWSGRGRWSAAPSGDAHACHK